MAKNKKIITDLCTVFNLQEKEDLLYAGTLSGYFTEFKIIIPDRLILPARLVIDINYKPNRQIRVQEKEIEKLRISDPGFKWISNCIRIEERFEYEKPNIESLQKSINKALTLLETKGFETIEWDETEKFNQSWDEEILN